MTAAADAPAGTPGEALRRRRRALSLTAAQVGALFGCSRVTLCHAETGTWAAPRRWWQRADGLLGFGGELLRLYDGAGPEQGPVWPVHDLGRRP